MRSGGSWLNMSIWGIEILGALARVLLAEH